MQGPVEFHLHRNSVLSGTYDRLEQGTLVRLAEKEGEEGPQASTVQVIVGGVRPGAEV